MLPMSSAITGALEQVETLRSSTGQQLSETGSAKSLTASEARAALVQRKPEETDRNLLRWLESSLNVVATPEARMMFPPTGGYYAKVTGVAIRGLNANNLSDARAAVEASMTAATVDQCEEWIAGLHSVTAKRTDDRDGQELAMTLYAGCLAMYPADIAKQVCMDFALRREKPNWFPTLSELDEACEKRAAQRTELLKALKR